MKSWRSRGHLRTELTSPKGSKVSRSIQFLSSRHQTAISAEVVWSLCQSDRCLVELVLPSPCYSLCRRFERPATYENLSSVFRLADCMKSGNSEILARLSLKIRRHL